MTISLSTDAFPLETSFEVRDLTDETVLFSVPGTALAANTTQAYSICADDSHCYLARVTDTGGNGGATFDIVFQGNSYSSAGPGGYGYITTVQLGATPCLDISPTLDTASYLITSAAPVKIGSMNRFYGSILADQSTADVCLGERNMVQGWIRGRKIALGSLNTITGYNGIELFGTDYGIGVCSQASGLGQNDFAVNSQPLGNTTDDCEEAEVVPSDQDIFLAGPGSMLTIFPGNYGKVTIQAGAALFLNEGVYTMEELSVSNSKLIPAPGGILCEILISTDKLTLDHSTVQATINCKSLNILDENDITGDLTVDDPIGTTEIGDKNSFSAPNCPPCQLGSKRRPGRGGIDEVPRLKTFPNPSDSGEIYFSYTEPGTLEIYNLNGRLVHRQELLERASKEAQIYELDAQILEPGMYIGRMITNTGQVLSQTFSRL